MNKNYKNCRKQLAAAHTAHLADVLHQNMPATTTSPDTMQSFGCMQDNIRGWVRLLLMCFMTQQR